MSHCSTSRHPERSEGSRLQLGYESSIAGRVVLFLIRVYQQFVSPLLPLGCRYYPTCSHYAAEAIARHGALRGTGLGAQRILRCHPFSRGGFDPVSQSEAHSHLAPLTSNPKKEPAR